jgi:hypothetical protein
MELQCVVCKEVLPMAEFVRKTGPRSKPTKCCSMCRQKARESAARQDNLRIYQRTYRERNKEKMVAKTKKWRSENKAHMLHFAKDLYARDPYFREGIKVRCATRGFLKRSILRLKGTGKDPRSPKFLGCDWKTLLAHIGQQFRPGMTWENYGEWVLDHKYPLAPAYKESPEKFAECCHYTNLQPLWKNENSEKHAKVVPY